MNRRASPVQHPRRAARSPFIAALVVISSCAPAGVSDQPENLPPIARATLPQRWVANRPAPVDTRYSFDPEGALTRVSVLFGDASPEVDAVEGEVAHTFPLPGTFDVRIEVEDDVAQVTRAMGTIVIVDDLDEPACSCTAPCPDDAWCMPGGCFLLISSEAADGERPEVTGDPAAAGGVWPPAIVCEAPAPADPGAEPN